MIPVLMDHIDKIVNLSRETKLLRASIVMIEVTMQMLEQATKTNLSPGTRWRRSEDRKVVEIPVTWRNTSQQFVFIHHRTPSWAYNQNQSSRRGAALVLVAIWSMKRSTAPVPHSAPSIALFVTSLELEDTEITLLSPNNCQLQLWSSQVGALHEQSSLSLRICFNLLRVLT